MYLHVYYNMRDIVVYICDIYFCVLSAYVINFKQPTENGSKCTLISKFSNMNTFIKSYI